MRCERCTEDLLVGKRFCHACGAPAPLSCAQCGAALDQSYRFCPECGSAVQPEADAPTSSSVVPASGEGERRYVTVLFCDLVGSTEIAEGLDPEEFHDLLEQYLAVAFPAVYRFEGVVNQLAGDGLMAIFGIQGGPLGRMKRMQRQMHDLQRSAKGLGNYECTRCGAPLQDRADVSPSGDVKCQYCDAWFNVHAS